MKLLQRLLFTVGIYITDILVMGSIMGGIFVLGTLLENYIEGTSLSYDQAYLKGLIAYWIADSLCAKFREAYASVGDNIK